MQAGSSQTGLLPTEAVASREFIKQGPGHGPKDAVESAASWGTNGDRWGLPVAIWALYLACSVSCPHLPQPRGRRAQRSLSRPLL